MGRLPKPADRRQGHRKRPEHLVISSVAGHIPDLPPAPRGLLKKTRDMWDRYWDSPMSQVADRQTDLALITRLFTLYDERERCYRGYRKQRLVLGSQGQLVMNPLGRHITTLDVVRTSMKAIAMEIRIFIPP